MKKKIRLNSLWRLKNSRMIKLGKIVFGMLPGNFESVEQWDKRVPILQLLTEIQNSCKRLSDEGEVNYDFEDQYFRALDQNNVT